MADQYESQLVERQNSIWSKMDEILQNASQEGRELSAEERQTWDNAEAELEGVSKDLERIQRYNSQPAQQNASTLAGLHGQNAQTSQAQEDERKEQYRQAFRDYMRGGVQGMGAEDRQLLQNHLQEVRAQGTSPNDVGGYTVPEGFREVIREELIAYGGLMQIANVMETATGNKLPWPTRDNSAQKGRIIDENPSGTTGSAQPITEKPMSFGTKSLDAYTYTSDEVLISLQLLQDSAFNMESYIASEVGQRIGRAVAAHLAQGTNSSQPQGVVNVATGHHITEDRTGSTQVYQYKDLVHLEHSIDPAYRNRGNCRYALSDAALKNLRLVTDADGRPIWLPVPTPGFPATINGYPYTVDNDLPAPDVGGATTVGGKSVFFGDFDRGYIVRRVRDIMLRRLEERYAENLQVAFFGFSRLDAMIDDAAAIRALQHDQTHTG